MHADDLKFRARYGKKYKLEYDHTVDGERIGIFIPSRLAPHKDTGQKYEVYEYGSGKLAAIMPKQKSRNLIKKFPFLKIKVEADDCMVLVFDAKLLGRVASDMELRKRRRLAPEHKEAFVKSNTPYRFK